MTKWWQFDDCALVRNGSVVLYPPTAKMRCGRYRLVSKGYSLCLVFLKLFEKIDAPLAAGLMAIRKL